MEAIIANQLCQNPEQVYRDEQVLIDSRNDQEDFSKSSVNQSI